MIGSLLFPELLLIIVPLLCLLFWRGRIPVPGSIVRVVVIVLLTLLAAFIGKNLTFRIVCEAWPELTLDHLDLSKDEDHEA